MSVWNVPVGFPAGTGVTSLDELRRLADQATEDGYENFWVSQIFGIDPITGLAGHRPIARGVRERSDGSRLPTAPGDDRRPRHRRHLARAGRRAGDDPHPHHPDHHRSSRGSRTADPTHQGLRPGRLHGRSERLHRRVGGANELRIGWRGDDARTRAAMAELLAG